MVGPPAREDGRPLVAVGGTVEAGVVVVVVDLRAPGSAGTGTGTGSALPLEVVEQGLLLDLLQGVVRNLGGKLVLIRRRDFSFAFKQCLLLSFQ